MVTFNIDCDLHHISCSFIPLVVRRITILCLPIIFPSFYCTTSVLSNVHHGTAVAIIRSQESPLWQNRDDFSCLLLFCGLYLYSHSSLTGTWCARIGESRRIWIECRKRSGIWRSSTNQTSDMWWEWNTRSVEGPVCGGRGQVCGFDG